MNPLFNKKSISVLASAMLFFVVSCTKDYHTIQTILPLETYSYQLYDSVEGTTNTSHYSLNRIIEFQFDPNVDKCYMANEKITPTKIDTFDRHFFWKRGYVNREDFFHRIIFNGDTITIHHKVENQAGESGFRYTHGVKL